MKKPTLDEVIAYWVEAKLTGNPAEFHDHFVSNGWMVGRSPMKDWQAAARNWSRNEVKWGHSGQNGHVTVVRGSSDFMDFPPGSPERAAALLRKS